MDIFTPASISVVIHAAPVNWLPWSVFMISGGPYLVMASSKASLQKLASIVFDNRHDRTLRVVQSMMATR